MAVQLQLQGHRHRHTPGTSTSFIYLSNSWLTQTRIPPKARGLPATCHRRIPSATCVHLSMFVARTSMIQALIADGCTQQHCAITHTFIANIHERHIAVAVELRLYNKHTPTTCTCNIFLYLLFLYTWLTELTSHSQTRTQIAVLMMSVCSLLTQ